MSSYYREQGFHSHKRGVRKLRYVLLALLIGLLIAGGWFGYDAYQQSKRSHEASAESKAVTSLIVSNTQLQSTPYFQFQSPKNWRIIANETRSNHFVFREYNGPLIEQELVIDINKSTPEVLALILTTRVLPVRVSPAGKLTSVGDVSDHCRDIIKPIQSANPLSTTYKGVKFNCNPQVTNYLAVVGLVGGTNDMELPRPSGGKAVYNITYRNLTAQPSAGDFDNIMQTFETR